VIYSNKKTNFKRTHLHCLRTALSVSLLSGLVAVGCTQPAVVSPTDPATDAADSVNSVNIEPTPTPTAPKNNTESSTDLVSANSGEGQVIANSNTNTASPATFEESVMSGIEKHIGYGQARAILIANGWTPGINNTENSERYRLDGTIRELVGKGYKEVQDCSGSGLGYCRFDFTYTGQGYPNQNGRSLSITTVYSQTAANGDPTIWDWGISEATTITSPADTSEAGSKSNQSFNAAAFEQLKQDESFCSGLAANCTNSEHTFDELTLTAVQNEIGGTIITLRPSRRMTLETAQTYAAILDTANNIDFAQPSIDGTDADYNLVKNYNGCPQMGEMGLGPSCFMDFTVGNLGVSEIRFVQTYAGQ